MIFQMARVHWWEPVLLENKCFPSKVIKSLIHLVKYLVLCLSWHALQYQVSLKSVQAKWKSKMITLTSECLRESRKLKNRRSISKFGTFSLELRSRCSNLMQLKSKLHSLITVLPQTWPTTQITLIHGNLCFFSQNATACRLIRLCTLGHAWVYHTAYLRNEPGDPHFFFFCISGIRFP